MPVRRVRPGYSTASDADVVSLAAAPVATRIATRADSTGRRAYGPCRAEAFAAATRTLHARWSVMPRVRERTA